jgi:signal peptidase I
VDRITDTDPATGNDPQDEPQKDSGGSFLYELPGLLLAALIVAVVIKTFVIQPFYIPSGSMIPTLEIDDRVMVSKVNDVFGEIERGEILVFENPYRVDEEESVPEAVVRSVLEALGIRTSAYDDLVKRVIALGGEEIEIRDNQLFIDGVALDEPYLQPGSMMPDFGPQVIPEGHLFMMGDNRNSSSDGRVFGPIPVEDVIGEAVVRIWPMDRLGGL